MKEQWKEWLRAAQQKVVPLAVKYRAVLIVLLAGVLLLASGGRSVQETAASADVTEGETAFDLAAFEQTLCDKLAAVDGVGRVQLMLSLEQSGEAVYAVNTRQTTGMDSSQSYESDLTILSDGSYGEKPVTVKNLPADISWCGRFVRRRGQCTGASGGDAGGQYSVRHRDGQSYGSENVRCIIKHSNQIQEGEQ